MTSHVDWFEDYNVLPNFMTFGEYYQEFMPGDFGLWTPTRFWGGLVAESTNGPFSHASGLMCCGDEILDCQFEEKKGGYSLPLVKEVARHPLAIHIFRVTGLDMVTRTKIGQNYLKDLDNDYNWSNIRAIALGHFIGLRYLVGPRRYRRWVDKAIKGTSGSHCSQHIAKTYKKIGFEFVRKDIHEITPNDLFRCTQADYVCTLSGV